MDRETRAIERLLIEKGIIKEGDLKNTLETIRKEDLKADQDYYDNLHLSRY